MQNIGQQIISLTINKVFEIARNRDAQVNKDKCLQYINSTKKEKVLSIIEEIKTDAAQADLFNQLDRNQVAPLVGLAGKVALQHGCTMWADEIFENSKEVAGE